MPKYKSPTLTVFPQTGIHALLKLLIFKAAVYTHALWKCKQSLTSTNDAHLIFRFKENTFRWPSLKDLYAACSYLLFYKHSPGLRVKGGFPNRSVFSVRVTKKTTGSSSMRAQRQRLRVQHSQTTLLLSLQNKSLYLFKIRNLQDNEFTKSEA